MGAILTGFLIIAGWMVMDAIADAMDVPLIGVAFVMTLLLGFFWAIGSGVLALFSAIF